MHFSRRDFLKSIAATAAATVITAVTGVAMSAVHIEEPELTWQEQRYAAALSREQCFLDDPAWSQLMPSSGIPDFPSDEDWDNAVQRSRSDLQGRIIQLLEADFHIVELLDHKGRLWAVTDQADVYFSDDWGVTWYLQEASTIERGNCQDVSVKLVGTVESVNDDGSVNVKLDDTVPLDFDGWMYAESTS
jgi:secreted PhoX family phosphatase